MSYPDAAAPAPGPTVAPSPTLARPIKGAVVAGLVALGLVVGRLIGYALWLTIDSNLAVLSWLLALLPWALAGLATAAYLRPGRRRVTLAAVIFAAPWLLDLVLHTAIVDALLPGSVLSAWLVLRGRPANRQWYVLAVVALSWVTSDIGMDIETGFGDFFANLVA